MSRAVFLPLLAMLALSGCSSGPLASGASEGNGGQVSLATQTACRERVNQIYDERNRGDIFAANSSMNSPQSANYLEGDTSRGLADRRSAGFGGWWSNARGVHQHPPAERLAVLQAGAVRSLD